MSISVCIATYNGEKYILDQILTILDQFTDDDELIIVDDCSTDNTVKLLESLNNLQIKIYQNEKNKGHVFSFSKAIALAKNDIIFLSDQDDIWVNGRVELMIKTLLNSGSLVVFSNYKIMNIEGKIEEFKKNVLKSNDSKRYFNNICGIFLGNREYYGCTMVFQKKITNLILPIPSFVKSHDLWIAFAANLISSIVHMDEITIIRRIHDKNVTITDRKVLPKIWSRRLYFPLIAVLFYRIIKKNIKLL